MILDRDHNFCLVADKQLPRLSVQVAQYELDLSLLDQPIGALSGGILENISLSTSGARVGILTRGWQFFLIFSILDPAIRTEIYLNGGPI